MTHVQAPVIKPLVCALTLCSTGAPAAGQAAPATWLPELTVTANKQQQLISDVAANITAYEAETLRQEGVDSLAQLEGKMAMSPSTAHYGHLV